MTAPGRVELHQPGLGRPAHKFAACRPTELVRHKKSNYQISYNSLTIFVLFHGKCFSAAVRQIVPPDTLQLDGGNTTISATEGKLYFPVSFLFYRLWFFCLAVVLVVIITKKSRQEIIFMYPTALFRAVLPIHITYGTFFENN